MVFTVEGYVLAEKKSNGVCYRAVVEDNSLVLYLESIPIKRLNAWVYDKKSAEVILGMEVAKDLGGVVKLTK